MSTNHSSTILVVDDNLGARRSIEALLADESNRFLLADSGPSALQILEDNTPDVILLDVMMPGMSGFDVCEVIRANPRISEIPIIMITALDDEESMIQGIDAGADDFLSKPISKVEIRSRIRSILRLNRFRKLCDERQKFELVVAQSHLGYVLIDEKNRIVFSNTSAQRMLLIDNQNDEESFFDVARRNFSIQPTDVEAHIERRGNLEKLDPFILVRTNQLNKQARWIRATFQELGLVQGTHRLLRLEDISDRITSFQEKHTFSRMITHKLLTPLNAIKAAHQLLNNAEASPERIERIAEIQKKGIERLEYDIHSVLGFLESERSTQQSLTVTDAAQQIQQIADSCHFSFKLTPNTPISPRSSIKISLHAFEACIREIVENAVKFHIEDVPSIHSFINDSPENSHVEFVFHNNSELLSEEELANAWKPYWQADRYVTGEIPGMGLGLSLVAANVWSAGGRCKIENCPKGLGVALTLTFPIVN